jgi:hypothetical protein
VASVNDNCTQPFAYGEAMFDVRFDARMLEPAPPKVMTFVSWQIEEGGWPGGHGEKPQVGVEVVRSSRSKIDRPTTSQDRPSVALLSLKACSNGAIGAAAPAYRVST